MIRIDLPLLDYMVQTIDGFVILQVLCVTPFTPSNSPRKLFRKGLVLPEFLEHWLVSKICDVLGIVEGSGSR